jgi:hypothetical protein
MTAVRGPRPVSTGPSLVDAYLARSTSTVAQTDRDDLRAFCDWLTAHRPDESTDTALRAVEPADLGAFVADQLRGRRGRRPDLPTVYRRLVVLGRFYAWAAAIGQVAANPVPPERRTGWTRQAACGPAG